MITIRTLGPVELLVDGGQAPSEMLWRKHLALLVYLARSPSLARSREHLVGLLWGDRPDSAARHSLNEALRILRRFCGQGVVETIGGQVRIEGCGIDIDTARFDRSFAAGDWAGAAGLVQGTFMEGFCVLGEWPFEEWLSLERRLWTDRSVTALVNRSAQLLSGGNPEGASRVAIRALGLRPEDESACRVAIKARALLGDRSGALDVYEAFAERLRNVVGIEPGPETSRLARRVRGRSGLTGPGSQPTEGS